MTHYPYKVGDNYIPATATLLCFKEKQRTSMSLCNVNLVYSLYNLASKHIHLHYLQLYTDGADLRAEGAGNQKARRLGSVGPIINSHPRVLRPAFLFSLLPSKGAEAERVGEPWKEGEFVSAPAPAPAPIVVGLHSTRFDLVPAR